MTTTSTETTPYTNATYQATIAQLRSAIEHAPTSPGKIALDLLG